MRSNSGFTLIELILVTVIIGILAGAVVVSVKGRVGQASRTRAEADIASYQNAIDTYALDNQDKYPKSLKELTGGKKNYVRQLKKDPWGNDYVYQIPGKHNKGTYDLFSKGDDGIAGNDDDVTNWDKGA